MWTSRRIFAAFKLMEFDPKAVVSHGKKETVVALFGWAGASDRNVSKYSDVYSRKGYTTVQFTAATNVKGWGTKYGREVKNLALALDSVLINESNRLLIHVFSMNGFLTLTSLDKQYPELKVLEKCDGLFLDSCPGSFTAFSMDNLKSHALVMDHVYDGMIKSKDFITGNFYRVYKRMQTVNFACRLVMDTMWVKSGVASLEEASPFHYLLHHPHLPPVISSIFSDADIVCSAEQIAEFNELSALRSDRRREMIVTRLKDSAHVEHFRKYPKLYMEQMEQFIQAVQKYRYGSVPAKL